MNRMAASEDMSSVRRNARTVTTTWRAKTPRTADVVEVKDMSKGFGCMYQGRMISDRETRQVTCAVVL